MRSIIIAVVEYELVGRPTAATNGLIILSYDYR